jgi:hypothetical protein
MPCAAYFFILATANALLSALITVRILALYARHVQQQGYAFSDHQDSHTLLPTPSFPTWHSRLDNFIARFQLYKVKVQLLSVCLLSSVRLAYYIARVITTPTYRSSSAVGCRFDLSEGVMILVLPFCFLGVLGPVFLRLLKRSDALGLRNELFLQVCD